MKIIAVIILIVAVYGFFQMWKEVRDDKVYEIDDDNMEL